MHWAKHPAPKVEAHRCWPPWIYWLLWYACIPSPLGVGSSNMDIKIGYQKSSKNRWRLDDGDYVWTVFLDMNSQFLRQCFGWRAISITYCGTTAVRFANSFIWASMGALMIWPQFKCLCLLSIATLYIWILPSAGRHRGLFSGLKGDRQRGCLEHVDKALLTVHFPSELHEAESPNPSDTMTIRYLWLLWSSTEKDDSMCIVHLLTFTLHIVTPSDAA